MKKLLLISLVIFFVICSRSWTNGLDDQYLKCDNIVYGEYYSFYDGTVTMIEHGYLTENMAVKRGKTYSYTMGNASLNWTIIGFYGDKIYYSLSRKNIEMSIRFPYNGSYTTRKIKCVIIDNYTEFYKSLKEEWKQQREGNKF